MKHYTVQEVAEDLGFTYAKTMKLVRNGIIEAERIGWFWAIPEKSLTTYKKSLSK